MKFSELNLKAPLLKALQRMNYEELTPIQEQTFPHVLSGRNLIATAETGSGKTSACGIPLIQRIDQHSETIQALVLVPTRELALQYVEEISRLSQYLNIRPFAIYGGFAMDIQQAKLNDLVHILIATPGRLLDMMYNGSIGLSHVQTFVLDEADEMLKQGFLEDIDFLFSCLVHDHQTLLFSATMPPEILRLAETYLKDPVMIELNREQIAPQSLEHHFQFLSFPQRQEALLSLLKQDFVNQAIIFCNSRHGTERLYDQVKNDLPAVEKIHGGLEQEKRSSIIRRFRAQQIRFIIATDLASRGLDFKHVSLVLNYDFPRDPVTYTHRTGRTGRMGRTGTAHTLVCKRDVPTVHRLIKENGISPVWIGGEPDKSQTHQPKGKFTDKRRSVSPRKVFRK